MKKILFTTVIVTAALAGVVAKADDQSTSYNRYGVSAPAQSVEAPVLTQAEIDAYTGQEVHYAQAQAKPADQSQEVREQEQLISLLNELGLSYEQAHALGIL